MRDSEAAKDLLYRRTRALVDYENANKNLEKARTKNKDVPQVGIPNLDCMWYLSSWRFSGINVVALTVAVKLLTFCSVSPSFMQFHWVIIWPLQSLFVMSVSSGDTGEGTHLHVVKGGDKRVAVHLYLHVFHTTLILPVINTFRVIFVFKHPAKQMNLWRSFTRYFHSIKSLSPVEISFLQIRWGLISPLLVFYWRRL